MRLALRTIMKRPASSSRCSCSAGGRSGTMPEIRWFDWKVSVCENQKMDSWVSTLPRSGIPPGSTWSKADRRSVATISSRSGPSSYVSRTLPRAKSLSGRSVSVRAGPGITAGVHRSLGRYSQSETLVGEVGVLEACPWVEDLVQPAPDSPLDLVVALEDRAEAWTGALHGLHGGFLHD